MTLEATSYGSTIKCFQRQGLIANFYFLNLRKAFKLSIEYQTSKICPKINSFPCFRG